MNLPRRRFLGSSLFALSGTLLDVLATPLWKWRDPELVHAAISNAPAPAVQFVDVAKQAGLTIPNVWGGIDQKRSILEAKGSGLDLPGKIPVAPGSGTGRMRVGGELGEVSAQAGQFRSLPHLHIQPLIERFPFAKIRECITAGTVSKGSNR